MVGTNVGRVEFQNEGYGTSVVPDTPIAQYRAKQAIDQDTLDKQLKAATDKANADKLLPENPDWWFKHNTEITNEYGRVRDLYAASRAAGNTNPFMSDPNFAKEFQKLQNKVEASKNLRIAYGALINDINSAPKESLDQMSVEEALKYYDQPISDIYEKGALQPPLKKIAPAASSMKLIGEGINLYKTTTGKKDFEPEDISALQNLMEADPQISKELGNSYSSWFKQLPPEIQTIAMEALGSEDAIFKTKLTQDLNTMSPNIPFNFLQTIEDVNKLVGDRVSTIENGKTTISSKNQPKQILGDLEKMSEYYLLSNEKALAGVVKMFNIGDGKEIPKAQAAKLAAKKLAAEAYRKKSRGYSRTTDEGDGNGGGGGGGDMDKAAFYNWLKRLKEGDPLAKSLLGNQVYRGGQVFDINAKGTPGVNRWPSFMQDAPFNMSEWIVQPGDPSYFDLRTRTNPKDEMGNVSTLEFNEQMDFSDPMSIGALMDMFYKADKKQRADFETDQQPNILDDL